MKTAAVSRRFVVAVWLTAVLVGLAALGALALAHEPVSGRLVMATDFRTPHPFVSILKPTDRIDGGRGGEVTGSPVYFDVKPPTDFERVTVEVDYRPGAAPLVEMGAMATGDGRFLLSADRVALFERLGWRRLESGHLVLLQRGATYASVEEFLRRPPPFVEVAALRTLQAPLPPPAGYVPSTERRAYAVSLRGSHRLLVYLGGEALDLRLAVQDMNREVGADLARLNVYRLGGGPALTGAALVDDGVTDASQRPSALRELAVRWTPPEPGYYLIDLDATDDIFVRSLETTARHLAFRGRVYLGDEVGYGGASSVRPTVLAASGRRLTAIARGGDALQTVGVGERGLALDLPGVPAETELDGTTLVTVQKRDVVLATDGLLALSPDALWPTPFVVDERTTAAALDAAGINYVLAETEPTATRTFETARLARTHDGAYRFVLAAPGLTAADGLAVEQVRFVWQRAPMAWGEWWRRLFTPDQPPTPQELPPAPDAVNFEERLP